MYHKIITSLNLNYFENGSSFNLTSWDKNFPDNVEIHVYSENLGTPKGFSNRIIFHNLYEQCPEVIDFEKQHKDNPHYSGNLPDKKETSRYKWNAIKFVHKVFPLIRFCKNNTNNKVYWIDADVYCQRELDLLTLDRWMPNDKIVSYLGRYDTHSECGFMGFNLHQKLALDFINLYESFWYNNKLDNLKETHDSFVFDVARKEFGNIGLFEDLNNNRQTDKSPLNNSKVGNHLTHAKGVDKDRLIQKAIKRDKNLRALEPTKEFRSDIHKK
jgi:hypothetical protein